MQYSIRNIELLTCIMNNTKGCYRLIFDVSFSVIYSAQEGHNNYNRIDDVTGETLEAVGTNRIFLRLFYLIVISVLAVAFSGKVRCILCSPFFSIRPDTDVLANMAPLPNICCFFGVVFLSALFVLVYIVSHALPFGH